MQRLEVSGAVRPLYGSLGVKGLSEAVRSGPGFSVLLALVIQTVPSLKYGGKT